jgi:cobalt-zinc-cadmium efflux system membrane fusion protein
MMINPTPNLSNRLNPLTALTRETTGELPLQFICQGTGVFLSLILLASSPIALAHGGHGDEFQGTDTTSESPESIQVDRETVQRLGIKIESASPKHLDVGIKTTGQIETLPNKKVEVTAPISGKVTELLVEPGESVRAGQAVAVLASSELVELRVASAEKRSEALADLKKAQADLQLAQENLKRQQKITAAEIIQAQTEVNVATEQYKRDRELVKQGAIPRRTMLESQAHLAEGKAKLAQATNQQEVVKAENEIKRATAEIEVANSRLQLSNTAYQTRLQQLGTIANAKGLVVVTTPIAGKVSDREVTLGQAFQDAGGKLMTIVNDSRVFATANIYEKDLALVKSGQRVRVKVASLPKRIFTGKIARIGSIVEGETRVVPVQAELDNPSGQLKPGLFAELEIITEQAPTPILAIPSSAVVEANGKNLVYLQNGNAFEAVEVSLGKVSGDLVEVKTGLFAGDLIVTQRAPQLYAQSLRGGNPQKQHSHKTEAPEKTSLSSLMLSQMAQWLPLAVGGVLGGTAFLGGVFWGSRRTRRRLGAVGYGESQELAFPTEAYLDNSPPLRLVEKSEESVEKN